MDIVDGTACGNDGALLPDAVRTELELLFDMHFPDRNCIARFVRSHYGRRSDWAGWNDALWRLLSEAGWRQLPRSMLRERAHWCYWWERELARVGDRAGAEWGRRWAERLMSWLPTAPEYDHAWTLDDWLDLFERYPNAYWAKRDTPLAEEYEPVTRRRVPIK
ncbi:MAG: hypothetical protein OEW09_04750 [Anaerolineae bacterium]|nr:hypothetical protein [Anaerolineae bacterium]